MLAIHNLIKMHAKRFKKIHSLHFSKQSYIWREREKESEKKINSSARE
jgi:hypothetical protein